MNYKISYKNYLENDIYETMNEVDNVEVFKSFTKAKQKMLQVLKMEKTEINARIRDVKSWTKSNIN
jgi:uncharacterized protein YfaP (DUF2135 family)